MMARRKTLGRYDLVGREPPGGLPPPTRRNLELVVGAVDDPYAPGHRVLVRINARTDILEKERSQRLISEAAYQAGRELQAAVEVLTHIGGGTWSDGDRIDAATQKENAIAYGLDRIKRKQAYMHRVEWSIGRIGAAFLVMILCDRMPFNRLAEAQGRPGARGAAQVAGHFRFLLESLADGFSAKGKAR